MYGVQLYNLSHVFFSLSNCLQSPKKNMTGLRRKIFLMTQKLLECDQKPLFQYIQDVNLLPLHFCMLLAIS
jgi:hypothetical protein